MAELLPIPVVIRLGSIAGAVAYYARPRERIIGIAQVEYVKSRGYLNNVTNSVDTIKSVFRHIGVFGAELLILRRLLEKDAEGNYLHITTDDDGISPQLKKQPNGLLAISGHIGFFELLAAYYADWGLKLTAVGRELNLDLPNHLLTLYRGEYGVETIWRADAMGVRKIIEAYQAGKVVSSLLDQDTHLPSRFAPFFGKPAAHPIGPIKLAIRKKARIVSSFIVRTGIGKHKCIVRDIHYDPLDPEAEQKVLDVFSQRLEELVEIYPDQWIWWHRRWRREPGVDYNAHPEILRSTKDYLEWLKSDSKAS